MGEIATMFAAKSMETRIQTKVKLKTADVLQKITCFSI